jgi:hypothetical protein
MVNGKLLKKSECETHFELKYLFNKQLAPEVNARIFERIRNGIKLFILYFFIKKTFFFVIYWINKKALFQI